MNTSNLEAHIVTLADRISKDHTDLVRDLKKNPVEIQSSLGTKECDLIHMTLGIAGEAGELLDAVKKNTMYGKALDYDNLIEELGDLEFYMEGMRQILNISREAVLATNIAKLRKRYGKSYSDQAAIQRADKQ